MRDWVETAESNLSVKRHRALLDVAIVLLGGLIFVLLISEAVFLFKKENADSLSLAAMAQFQARETALLKLDEILAQGDVIQEFAATNFVNDAFRVDAIRTRLTAARELLLGDEFQSFPQSVVQDLVRLLGYYLSYQANSADSLVAVSVPLNPNADSQSVVNSIHALRVFQRDFSVEFANVALEQRQLWRKQNELVFAILLLCLIPLIFGAYLAKKFAREHKDILKTRTYFNRFIDALPGVVLLTDHSGKIVSASQSAANFLMYSRNQLSDMDMSSLLPKRFRQQYQLFSKNYIESLGDARGQQVKGRELLVMNADGVEIPVEVHFGDFDTTEGGILVVCFADVTERRHLYQQYQHSQKRFEMAMMASRDGLWDWDMISNSVFFSPAWLKMMGIRGGQPLDSRVVFEDSIHPDDRARLRASIQTFIKSDQILFRDEHRLRRRDGSMCDAVTRACAQRDNTGKVIRIVGMHSDVTHFKEAEREVRRLNRNLEDRVRLRTQQLETALLQAEAANRTKATFLAVMGHEIRTPMNGIIGMADLLSKTKIDREQGMMVDTVRRSSMSLLGTLDNILDYSALESGDVELDTQSIQLVEFVEGVADEFADRAYKNKLHFILHVDPDVPVMVTADATRLRKILVNLLDNAMKFTNSVAGQGLVQLRLGVSTRSAGPRQRVEFEVIDNGIGVSREMRKQLFKPFMLEENSRARRFGGTGLGLAITTRLLRIMGGDIALDEERDRGSRFIFSIPFTVDDTVKRIPLADGVTVLARVSDPLLKESVQSALALVGQQLTWIKSSQELDEQVSAHGADKLVLIVCAGEDGDLVDYCENHEIEVISITNRSTRATTIDHTKVYRDPLLPSALARAVEYKSRFTYEKL
ncbi:PAS domain-containing hybrid sensor histidine kinase/response regulator [Zhongshania sp. BJYM1]|uniref:PAS domain-containing hybrid sensor histidine kinase/response regulator n=1 Tax=Zhongshania aquatica TaxID=2965069 RepID=UPI0022B4C6EE|nr:hybrid sensor histidine kinase/response regulator [Marortus sp. BJYM1]